MRNERNEAAPVLGNLRADLGRALEAAQPGESVNGEPIRPAVTDLKSDREGHSCVAAAALPTDLRWDINLRTADHQKRNP